MTTEAINELWLPVVGYEGLYEISSIGRLKALPRWRRTGYSGFFSKEKIHAPKTGHKKYQQYELRKDGVNKSFRKSRLVAVHFIPNPLNKEQVNHINGHRQDDRVENLEWATQAENIQHSYDHLGRQAAYKGRFGKDHNQSVPVIASLGGNEFEFESKTSCANHLKVTVQAIAQAIKYNGRCKKYSIKEKVI